MEKHIVYSYDSDLNKLRSYVIESAKLIVDLLSIASKSIEDFQQSFVEVAENKDRSINELDEKIEALAISLVALRQPMAIDLRNIVSSLRLAVIIERMGDLVKKVSHRTEFLNITLTHELKHNFLKLVSELKRLLESAIIAYDSCDKDLAIETAKQDFLIDELFSDIMQILEAQITQAQENAKALINLILVARNLERVGDYIAKIANITHFISTGKKISFNLEDING